MEEINMNKTVKEKLVLKKSIRNALNKFLITVIIFLIGMIIVKQNPTLKSPLKENIYEKSFKFTKSKKLYEKYFGNILSLDKVLKEEQPVFSEKLSFEKSEAYKKGVKLKVADKYMVPALESGIVVFLGEKENYGNTIIIEQVDGIDTYYANINVNNIKLYDYIEKGELLGETKDNDLYLVFQKNGEYLDYQKYI